MARNISAVLGFKTPSDGKTKEEKLLEKEISQNTVYSLYSKLPTSRMKFIVAAHFELGYTQEMIAEILSTSQPNISAEIKTIQDVFIGRSRRSRQGKKYKPKNWRTKPELSPEDVMRTMVTLISA